MKKFFISIISLISILFVSCSQDSINTDNLNTLEVTEYSTYSDVELNDEQILSIETQLEYVRNLAEEEHTSINFKIFYDSTNLFSLGEIEIVDPFVNDFEQGFSGNDDLGSVTIYCSDSDQPTVCPPGESQGNCVGSAVIKCLLNGECAEVCEADATLSLY